MSHCGERSTPRPPDATHRVIYSLYVELEPLPGEPANKSAALVVPLNRDGMPAVPASNGNGRPRAPKRRTIDLRAGDQVLCMGCWRVIKGVAAYRAHWLMEGQAESCGDGDGYLYHVPLMEAREAL